jgi:hypothetical protein
MSDEFSVCQFFANGAHEYVCRFVSAEEAVRTFKQYTHNVSAQTSPLSCGSQITSPKIDKQKKSP